MRTASTAGALTSSAGADNPNAPDWVRLRDIFIVWRASPREFARQHGLNARGMRLVRDLAELANAKADALRTAKALEAAILRDAEPAELERLARQLGRFASALQSASHWVAVSRAEVETRTAA